MNTGESTTARVIGETETTMAADERGREQPRSRVAMGDRAIYRDPPLRGAPGLAVAGWRDHMM